MGSKLNRHAYEGLIEEDVARVMKEMPDSLEREHVIQVLRHSVECYYPTSAEGPGTQAGQPGAGPDTPPTYVHAGPWIDAKERMPEHFPVLGWDGHFNGPALVDSRQMFKSWSISHWLPLPDRPQTISGSR